MSNGPENSMQNPWYCLRTQPKREHIAAGQLRLLAGVDVFAPRIRFRRRTARGKVWFDEALFPGYLFVRFNYAEMLRAVSSAVGVRGLVRFAGECAVVPNALIDALQSDQTIVIADEPDVAAGDRAVVADGALCGLSAVIQQVMPGGERVRILLEIMGTAVMADVPVAAVEKVT